MGILIKLILFIIFNINFYLTKIKIYLNYINMGIEKKILKQKIIVYNISKGIEKMTDNKELESKINYISNINMVTEFITFRLGYNTKNPMNPNSQWGKTQRHKWAPRTLEDLEKEEINHGMPCGKINGFWVLDIDNYKDKETCQFTSNFGDIAEYVKDNNIFAVNTTSGGWHLYFAYNTWYAENIKQTQNAEFNLDIRSDGGFVVAPGSAIDGKPYTVFNNGKIDKCPIKLTMFLKDNLYKKKEKPIRNKIIKVKNPITLEIEEVEEDFIDLGVYKFGFTDNLIKKIFNNMPSSYYKEYGDWLLLTTALKTLDKKEIWQELSKKYGDAKYNEQQNNNNWDGIKDHNKLFMVHHCLANCKLKNANVMLDYYKYKPVPEPKIKPDIEINKEKLGYTFFNDNINNLIVKSDTGTGKTTSFKHYSKNKPFISIVSRVSLGVEQMRIFKEHGIKCNWHEDISTDCQEEGAHWGMFQGDNIVITVDSLIKLSNWDQNIFKKYTIYLDEFNSLIEHLICSPTMSKTRSIIYTILLKMLKLCNRYIGTDADINDISLRFLQANNLNFNFIKNNYKHNRGVEAHEIFSFNKFIKKVKDNNKWLICCDSKTQAEVIAHVNHVDYLIITSDGWYDSKTKTWVKGVKSLDSHDRVIYSPAILYGLDSIIKRPVFCYYKGHTIDPQKMVQQICRCRNIVNVYYLFANKKWAPYKYHNYKEIEAEIIEYQQYGCKLFSLCSKDQEEQDKIYLELLARYKYMADCFNTNKFAHFINIMQNRGFILKLVFTYTGEKGVASLLKDVKDLKKEDLINFDLLYNKRKEERKKEGEGEQREPLEFYPPAFVKINEMLRIPYGQLSKYSDMFLGVFALTQHFTTIDYFFKTEDYIKGSLLAKEDYIVNKTTTNESKLLTIHKFKCLTQKFLLPVDNITLDKPLEDKTAKIFLKEYNLVFRNRSKTNPDFTDLKVCQQYLVKMYKACFGTEIIKAKKSTKKQEDGKIKSNTTYIINAEELNTHTELYQYRKPIDIDIDIENALDFGITDNIDC